MGFLPLAVYGSLTMMRVYPTMFADFAVYYSASMIVAHSPSDLYHYQAYLSLYDILKSVHFQPSNYFPFSYSPPIALFLWPLHFFNYTHAYLAWSAVNAAGCFLLAGKMGRLAESCGLGELNAFFQSCVFGLVVTAYVFWTGQISIILCLLFAGFLVEMGKPENGKSFLWFTAMLLIKPQFFLFIFLYFLGCRQWRFVLAVLASYLAFVLVSSVILGPGAWIDYVYTLSDFAARRTMAETSVVSLRGILTVLSPGHGFLYNQLAVVMYIAFNALCLLIGLFRKKPELQDICLLLPIGLLLSPYLLGHDTLLLLPVCPVFTRLLNEFNAARWMALCYILSGYAAIGGGLVLFAWDCRILLIVFSILTIYIANKQLVRKDFAS
jgi:hypothetical protein